MIGLKLVPAMRNCLVAAALVLAACGQNAAAPGAASDVTVLKDFTLIDGTGAAPAPDSAMVLTGGKISWVGPASSLQIPDGAKTVELAGKYVMPGLIDLHVHLGNTKDLTQHERNFTKESVEADLKTYASYGVTTVMSAGTDKDLIFPIRAEQRAGRPTMARVYTAGQGLPLAGGYGGVPGINKGVGTVAEAVAAVDAQAAKGVDFIKFWLDDEQGVMPKFSPEMTKAIIDAGHRHNLKVYAHVFYLEDAKRLVDQGVDGFMHSVRDQPVDQALIDAMKAKGVVQIAETLSREASLVAFSGPSPIFDDPFFQRSLSPAALQLMRGAERQAAQQGLPYYAELPAFEQMAIDNTRRLREGGVTVGFGTDSGPPGRFPGYFTHWELELLTKAGMTPSEAIRTATSGAAAILGNNELGSLQVGKWGDLIVLDADPTADILNTRKINAVYIAGNPVAPSTR